MIDTIEEIRQLLEADDIIICGSYALNLVGLRRDEEVGDLDLVVSGISEKGLKKLDELALLAESRKKMVQSRDRNGKLIKPSREAPRRFVYKGLHVDIFVVPEHNYKLKIKDNVYIIDVGENIEHKKRMYRDKDIEDLKRMSLLFTKFPPRISQLECEYGREIIQGNYTR